MAENNTTGLNYYPCHPHIFSFIRSIVVWHRCKTTPVVKQDIITFVGLHIKTRCWFNVYNSCFIMLEKPKKPIFVLKSATESWLPLNQGCINKTQKIAPSQLCIITHETLLFILSYSIHLHSSQFSPTARVQQLHSPTLHSRPAFSFSSTVWSPLEPPMQGGLLARVGLLPHCSGVFAWIASAWTQLLNSSFKAPLTRRWRCISDRPSNWELTTRTRKWDSDPGGTACMWLSLWISKWSGLSVSVSLVLIDLSTGRLGSGSMCGLKWARGRLEARLVEMGRAQRRTVGSIGCCGGRPPMKARWLWIQVTCYVRSERYSCAGRHFYLITCFEVY